MIEVRARAMYHDQFTSPAPTYLARIFNDEGVVVGKADFGVSPINDQVFIYEIAIEPKWQRRGYGTSFMFYLHEMYQLPITPVHEWFTAQGFWGELRRRRHRSDPIVTEEIRAGDMDRVRMRWHHLSPEMARLKQAISHRIFELHEPYEVATGRGLDDWDQGIARPRNDDAVH